MNNSRFSRAVVESLVELLTNEEDTPDLMIEFLFLVTTIFVFILLSFPYKKCVRDWQLYEFSSFLFYFCGTTIRNDSCAKHQTDPGLVVLRFLTKRGFAIVSDVMCSKNMNIKSGLAIVSDVLHILYWSRSTYKTFLLLPEK